MLSMDSNFSEEDQYQNHLDCDLIDWSTNDFGESEDDDDNDILKELVNVEAKKQYLALLSTAFYVKHGPSNCALKDHLALLKITLPENDVEDAFRSPYLFQKSLLI
ncbi:hypothetical protein OUZ56_010372 [Daphnia magna]|uniref:Uncharacterized protein n=1 Tax=Daphnia magna TaxID=35525 RepID=A0ABR0AIC6_9CRUS|nr:hypothetical protein OUZ56_010372 [Daphnia magna]